VVEPERVGERLDVGGAVGDPAPSFARRVAVPRAVVPDQADSLFARERFRSRVQKPRAGRAMVDDDRGSARVAALVHSEAAPV